MKQDQGSLRRWQRLTAGAMGGAFSVAGAVSVFLTDNQAGSAALIVVGAVAGVSSIVGRFPRAIGKDQVTWAEDPYEGAAAEILATQVSDESRPIEERAALAGQIQAAAAGRVFVSYSSDEVKQTRDLRELMAAAEDDQKRVPDQKSSNEGAALAGASRGALAELQAMNVLRSQLGASSDYLVRTEVGGGRRYDAVVEDSRGRSFKVDIKWIDNPRSLRVLRNKLASAEVPQTPTLTIIVVPDDNLPATNSWTRKAISEFPSPATVALLESGATDTEPPLLELAAQMLQN